MLRFLFFAAALILHVCPAFCQEAADPPRDDLSADHQELLRLVQLIRQDPAAEAAREYYAAVFKIVERDEHIFVAIAGDNLPWFMELKNHQKLPLLLGAFVAGNAEAQVREGKMEDNPYAGTLLVILAYQKLKTMDASITSQAIEKFIEREKAGTLKDAFVKHEPRR